MNRSQFNNVNQIAEWESSDGEGKSRKGAVYCKDGVYRIKLYHNGELVRDWTMSDHNKAEFYAREEAENWCLNKR